MKIDSHQHFWKYTPHEYPWMADTMAALQRDFLPADLAPLLQATGIEGTVAVQARQTLEESDWLLGLADRYSFIQGVVGWVDLRDPQVDEQLARLASHPKFRGVRHLVQDEPDMSFLLREDFRSDVGALAQYGLTYDLLIFPRHLPTACEFVALFPDQAFILDHLAKPRVRERQLLPWGADLRRLARFPNVHCKLSGLVTEADWTSWQPQDFTPYLDLVWECFGTKRLLVGSDWPVCTLAASYSSVVRIAHDFVSRLSPDEQADVWSKNAKRVYGLRDDTAREEVVGG